MTADADAKLVREFIDASETERDYEEALAALDRLVARCEEAERAADGTAEPCVDGHDTSEMLWPGTAHQGVVCRRCQVFLPC